MYIQSSFIFKNNRKSRDLENADRKANLLCSFAALFKIYLRFGSIKAKEIIDGGSTILGPATAD